MLSVGRPCPTRRQHLTPAPSGEEVIAEESPEVKFDRVYQRLNVSMAGIQVPEAGDYAIIVERYTKRKWSEVKRVPFSIAEAGDQEPEAKPDAAPESSTAG